MGPEFFLVGKLFILITGASKGIGRQFAIKFSQIAERDSHFLLIARNETGLQETVSKMSHRVNVDYVSLDLSIAQADQLIDIIRKRINPEEYDNAIIIHNVASTGDLSQLTNEMNDFRVWKKMFDLNVFSSAVLNSVFMEIFNDKVKAKKLVINMTSVASRVPSKSGAYYCSAKAAREMYFKVFAKEFPQVNVLNYSPFLTQTDLLEELDGIKRTAELPIFSLMFRFAGLILTPNQVADRLVEIIRGQKYKSGDFVDYYDPLTSTVLLTGNGRGFAIKFSQIAERDSHFLLIARNETGLQETVRRMSNRVHVDYISMDLSIAQAGQLEDMIRKRINPNEYDNAIIIHNVGATGDTSQLTDEMIDFYVWRKMYDLNVFSPAILNSVFMKIFNNNVKAKKLVINITSFATKIPLSSLGYYCSAKAAREMYFKVFAKEFPYVNVLNYSPFAVETDLLRAIEQINRTIEVPALIKLGRLARIILTPNLIANCLVQIIQSQMYESGDFIDYHDPIITIFLLANQKLPFL